MAGEWPTLRVDQIAERTAAGPFGSSIGSKHFRDTGIPIIRGSNLSTEVGTRLMDEGLVYLSEEKAAQFERSEARPGDLIFTCWGTIDQIGLIDRRAKYDRYIVSNKQMLFRPNRDLVKSLFLYYAFSAPEMRERILNNGIGSSVPGFNLGQLRSITLSIPPLKEQQAIACILGALDDKIELNRRMNRTLEGIARAIFKSWFVDFDPVRAKAAGQTPPGLLPHLAALFPDSFDNSELGEIPKGWRAGTLDLIGREIRDGVGAESIEPGTPYIALEHMPKRCISLPSWEAAEGIASNKLRFRTGDILFGKLRPYFQKVGPAPIDGVCSTDIVVVRAKAPCWYGVLLGHMISDEFVDHTDRGSTGTKMPRTNWRDMSAYNIVLPPDEIANGFSTLAMNLVERIRVCNAASRTLAALRDSLLPKLISGELRIPDAERIVGRAL